MSFQMILFRIDCKQNSGKLDLGSPIFCFINQVMISAKSLYKKIKKRSQHVSYLGEFASWDISWIGILLTKIG